MTLIKDYGVFVEFGLDSLGFLHISGFNYTDLVFEDIEVGQTIKVKVRKYSNEHHRYELEFAE